MNLINLLDDVHCGDFTFDFILPSIVSKIVLLIQIGVPILLIIFGMLDLGKAVMAQKEDEIKKGQQTFIKRLIAAAIVFFVIVIVKFLIGIVVPNNGDTAKENTNIVDCINCFMTGKKANCK